MTSASSDALEGGRPSSAPLRRFVLSQARGGVVAVVAASIVVNLLMLTGPLFMLQVYDRVLPSRSYPTLVTLFALVTVLYVFYVLSEILRSRLMARIAAAVDLSLSGSVFQHEVETRRQGDGHSLLRSSEMVRTFISGPVPLALLDLPWTPLYLILVYLLDPMLGLVAVVGLLVVCVLALGNELSLRKTSEQLSGVQGRRDAWFRDATRNTDALVAMGIVDHTRERWEGLSGQMNSLQASASDRAGTFTYSTRGFRLLLQSAVLAVGALLVLDGEVSAGVMIAASVITARALAPVEQLAGQWRTVTQVRPAARDVSSLLTDRNDTDNTMLPVPSHRLDVQKLSVKPPGGDIPVLHGIDVTLEAGTVLAIIGPSGAGKTALVRALTGVWSAAGGSVRFDGASLDQFAPAQRRSIIGYLPQALDLIVGTVAENISGFDPDATSEAIVAAANEAGAHDFIVSLSAGYETRLTEGGANLSAGQRQRLGLARALYGSPFMLVLDEPNSHLDNIGENALSEAVTRWRSRGGIVVLVAHRPAILRSADQVLHLERGRQVHLGPAADVLRDGVQTSKRVTA